jgi:hypothetical protein
VQCHHNTEIELTTYQEIQEIKQLEKRKGGYFYLKINAEIINQFERKRATRMICTIDKTVSYRCGLNHLGDGNFYVIVAGKYLDELNKKLGDKVDFRIEEDPDQLGVDIPEVLTVLLTQDAELNSIYEKLTDGKKRSLIYSFNKIKDIDKQVNKISEFLMKEETKLNMKKHST